MTFYPNIPKYIQIQLQIILFLLFWDVLWIIKDLLAPLSLFLHEFQQNSQFLRTILNDPDLGRVAYNHEYTQIYIKISTFKSLIYINYFYIFTEILILKILQKWSAEEKYWWRKGSILMSLTTMALMNIDGYKPKYTWKGHISYYFWGLNEIKSYFRQSNSSLFKTYANFSWFKTIAMWASGMSKHRKKGAYWSFPVFIYIVIHIKKCSYIFYFYF